MKNLKTIALLSISALFLAGCSENPINFGSQPSKDNGETLVSQGEKSEGKESAPEISTGGNSQATQTGDSKLKMPTNLKMVITHSASIKPYEMYKVGDTYEFIHNNDYGYATKTANGYVSYLGEKSGGTIEWDSEGYNYASLFKMLSNNDFGEVAELGDPFGYCNQYCSEKSEKKTICGIETTLFGDDNFSFYIDKTTNLCLEYHIGSQVVVVATEYTTTGVTLPFAAPTF
ncbi:MAG: hypothetical protein MJ238_05995 [Bacilli bacterium]|nr:hypothetical protein [Bacilli bacterium]